MNFFDSTEDDDLPVLHLNFDVSGCEVIFDASAEKTQFAKVKIFEAQLVGEQIVLPIELTDGSGKTRAHGVSLSAKRLREMLTTYEFDEFIEVD